MRKAEAIRITITIQEAASGLISMAVGREREPLFSLNSCGSVAAGGGGALDDPGVISAVGTIGSGVAIVDATGCSSTSTQALAGVGNWRSVIFLATKKVLLKKFSFGLVLPELPQPSAS